MWFKSCCACAREEVISLQPLQKPEVFSGRGAYQSDGEVYELGPQRDPEEQNDPFLEDAGTKQNGQPALMAAEQGDADEFLVTLEKADLVSPFGVQLDGSTGSIIYVSQVSEDASCVSEYNQGAREERRLQTGDFVFEVNGIGGDMTRMMKEVHVNNKLEMLVRRPIEFNIQVRKAESLGCSITYDANTGVSLGIACVLDGPVKAWNEAHPAAAVYEGDRIIMVNGRRGSTAKLLDLIKGAEKLELTLARPSGGSADLRPFG